MLYVVPLFGGLVAFVATVGAASRLMRNREVTHRRNFPRYRWRTAVRLCWRDERGMKTAERAKMIEISEHGLSVRCRQPLKPDSPVFVSVEKHGFALAGHVRHCRTNWRGNVIGIEVQGPPVRNIDGVLDVDFVSAR
jgi:hypothetical protein